MNSPRHRAGSRRNKHQPVARQTCVWDTLTYRRAYLTDLRADLDITDRPGGFSLPSILGHRSKPSHPFRAVDIDACFGERLPERDSAKAAAARRAGDCGRYAAAMTVLARRVAYLVPGGDFERGPLAGRSRRVLTPAQNRRIAHKARRCGEWVA